MDTQSTPIHGGHTPPPGDTLGILLAVPDPLTAQDHARLRAAGLSVLAEVGSARALARLLTSPEAATPQVVLVHDGLERLDRFPDLAERITARWGAATVLLVPDPALPASLSQGRAGPRTTVAPAMRSRARNAGYASVALWPGDPDDLYDAALAALSALPHPGRGVAAALPEAPVSAPPTRALLIGVRGEKGGTGKTMVVENLCALATLAGLRVLLLDMDQNGSAFLDVLRGGGAPSEGKGILAYLAAYTQWRAGAGAAPLAGVSTAARLLASATMTYPVPATGRPGYALLPGVRGRDQGDLLDLDEHLEALDMLSQAARASYDLVVVDMGQSHLHAMHQGWAAEVDRLVVVTEPKFRSVAGAAEGQVKLMNTIAKKSEQCLIVVNRVRDSRYQMLAADLRAHFSRGLGEDEAAPAAPTGRRAARPPALEIVGILRDAPELVDQGEHYHIPWVLLPDAAHHRLMDDFCAMATGLLGAGVLPERRPGAVVLGRVRAAVRRLFHPSAGAATQEALPPAAQDTADGASAPGTPADEQGTASGGLEATDMAENAPQADHPNPVPTPGGIDGAWPATDGLEAAPWEERPVPRARVRRPARRRVRADENGHDATPPAALTTGLTGDGAAQ